jgi:RNA polymerase sigma-70 factor (ECF subfamily)
VTEASRQREEQWAHWLRQALAGDEAAYERFLAAVVPHLRILARRRAAEAGLPTGEAEDIVQETLIAIHLKRGTWDPTRPIGPWISTIVRNKMIDALRRRGRRSTVPIEDVIETLEAPAPAEAIGERDLDRLLAGLKSQQLAVVRSISLGGMSVRETALKLSMSETAVRVTLHRALKKLASLYRAQDASDDVEKEPPFRRLELKE